MCDPRSTYVEDRALPVSSAAQNAAVMSAPQPAKLCPRQAGRDLARLMERQLGYAEGHIDPIALRLFIRAYWSRVSTYAHAIHDEADAA